MARTATATLEKTWIPKVPEKRIRELGERIKPVIRFAKGAKGLFRSDEGHPHYIKPVDLFGVAYTWNPKPAERAKGLKPVCDITTYHGFAYHGFFKPSVAEVLAQIPKEHLDSVVAFEILDSPQTASDLNAEHEALNAGYHVATTRLYKL
ncbi:MAG: hypothetical protein AAB421_04930 [Patescibacteria group bacterium]